MYICVCIYIYTHTHHVAATRSSLGGGLSAAQRRAVLSAALRSGLFQAPRISQKGSKCCHGDCFPKSY